jgi:branched-chain amino acid transport system substrate-binding protein
MKKRFLVVFTMLLIGALFFSACAPAAVEEAAPAEEEAPVEEEVKLPTEIVIGATLPLSGEGAPYGEMFVNGLTLGVDRINSEDSLNGIQVKLVPTDSRAEAEESVTQFQRLVQVDGAIYISTAYSAPPLAQAPLADQTKTVLINGGGFAPELRGAAKFLFNNVPLSTDEGKVVLSYAYNDLGLRKLGLIIASSYSKDTYDFMMDFWKGMGGEVVIEARHDVGASDLRSQLELLKGAEPDAVLLLNDGNDTILTLTQAEQVDFKPQWLGFAGQMIEQIMSLPGAQGMIASSVVYEPDPEFVTAYNDAYDSDPNFYIANYYDQTIVFEQAVQYVIENQKEINGENLQDAIYAIREFDGVNGTFAFLDDGTITRDMLVVEVVDSAQSTLKKISATDN